MQILTQGHTANKWQRWIKIQSRIYHFKCSLLQKEFFIFKTFLTVNTYIGKCYHNVCALLLSRDPARLAADGLGSAP